jgi:hypothetical protein
VSKGAVFSKNSEVGARGPGAFTQHIIPPSVRPVPGRRKKGMSGVYYSNGWGVATCATLGTAGAWPPGPCCWFRGAAGEPEVLAVGVEKGASLVKL